MQTFDAKNPPSSYLQGQWACGDTNDTRALARASVLFLRPQFEQASITDKYRLGLTSDDVGRGKSTYLKALLRELYPTEKTAFNVHEGFGIELDNEGSKVLFFYDQRRTKTLHRISRFFGKMGRDYRQHFDGLKATSSIHVIEWPERSSDRQLNALWKLQRTPDRLKVMWSLYCPPEISNTAEYKNFEEQVTHLRVG